MLLHLLADAVVRQHGGIDAAILHGVAAHDDVRRHVLGEGGAGLYHGALSHPDARIGDDAGGEDGPVENQAVACYLRAVAEDAVVANLGVVRHVHALHEEVVVAYHGLSAGVCGAVDDHILTDDVVVADDELTLLPPEIEVLRQCSDDGALVNLVALAHTGAVEDAGEGEDNTSVANLHVALYIDKGENLAVVADFCFRVDFCSWTDITCHNNVSFFEGSNTLRTACALTFRRRREPSRGSPRPASYRSRRPLSRVGH